MNVTSLVQFRLGWVGLGWVNHPKLKNYYSKLPFWQRFLSKSFKGSCTRNGIISGKPWTIYKNFFDKINLHTKLYILPFYKKNCILKSMSEKTSRHIFLRKLFPKHYFSRGSTNYSETDESNFIKKVISAQTNVMMHSIVAKCKSQENLQDK